MTFAQAPILPQIVGVLNVTPDSFSDTGEYLRAEDAIRKAISLVEDGADIVDIGGESTGSRSKAISAEAEWKRLEPVLKVIGRELIISLDTYKAEVAQRALQLGVKIINDVSALRADPNMASVVADAGCKVILMHSKEGGERPHVSDFPGSYTDVVGEVAEFLTKRVQYAVGEGIKLVDVILDPGMGLFLSKDTNFSWEVLNRIQELHSLKLPLLVGVSRKGFLKTLNETSPSDRDPVSALIGVHLAQSGVSYIRTHNVKLTKEFLTTWNKLTVSN